MLGKTSYSTYGQYDSNGHKVCPPTSSPGQIINRPLLINEKANCLSPTIALHTLSSAYPDSCATGQYLGPLLPSQYYSFPSENKYMYYSCNR